jgi:carboxyl-terminal processing protease
VRYVNLKRGITKFGCSLRLEAWLFPVIAVLLLFFLSLEFLKVTTPAVPVRVGVDTPADRPLTCAQVAQIGRWSGGRYGGPIKVDMQTSDFSRRVSDTFLEKLDPFKVIFLESEAEEFKRQAIVAWGAVMKEGRCDAFDQWVNQRYAVGQNRLREILNILSFNTKVGTRAQEAQYVNDRAPHYTGYAKDRAQLTKRLTEFGKRVAEYTNPRVLPAYQNSSKRLVTDSIEQLLFAETLPPRNLLAKAMLGSLDPFSTYLSPTEFNDFYQDLAGGTTGVGIKVRKVPQGLLVEKILKDSPAERSGELKVGAILTAVDGNLLRDASLQTSKKWLKGPENSHVRLDWIEPATGKSKITTVVRATFTHDEARITHRLAMSGGQPIAIIEIPTFYGRGGFDATTVEERSSAEDLERVIKQLMNAPKNKRPVAIVLDLRDNPGGYLEEAVSMGGLFLGNRPVVGVVERDDRRVLRDHRTALYTGPLLVLVDKESASASEVLAGALKDHQRALVVGDSASYGKGSVQRLFHLSDELTWINPVGELWSGVVKLTTSVFYSPLGHSPANGGVTPNLKLAAAKIVSDLDSDAEPRPKKSWAVPETRPFLEGDELRTLQRSSKLYDQKLAVLKTRNPWVTQSGKVSKAVEYLAVESGDDDDDSADEILDKTVNVAAEYALIDQTLGRNSLSAAARAE